eukprot:2164770-Prymnesium_polylepis.1
MRAMNSQDSPCARCVAPSRQSRRSRVARAERGTDTARKACRKRGRDSTRPLSSFAKSSWRLAAGVRDCQLMIIWTGTASDSCERNRDYAMARSTAGK